MLLIRMRIDVFNGPLPDDLDGLELLMPKLLETPNSSHRFLYSFSQKSLDHFLSPDLITKLSPAQLPTDLATDLATNLLDQTSTFPRTPTRRIQLYEQNRFSPISQILTTKKKRKHPPL